MSGRRTAAAAASLVLLASGLFIGSGVAQAMPAPPSGEPSLARTTATLPCTSYTQVLGVQNGYLKLRYLTNRKLETQLFSSTQLPGPVDSFTSARSTQLSDGVVWHYTAYAPGRRPYGVDVTYHDGDKQVQITPAGPAYLNAFPGRSVADSGSYYAYGINNAGQLVQYTRYRTQGGNLYFSSKRVVAKNQGGIRTLSWIGSTKRKGVALDLLVATTKSGALKHFSIPMKKPARTKITVLRKKGFSAYDEVSLTGCSTKKNEYLGLVLIDTRHNLARLFTVRNWVAPVARTVTNHGLVAPGADWTWHAVR